MSAAHSPARATIAVPGGQLAFESLGEGPPILFLHSAIADQRMWDREMTRYSAGHRAMRFDQRGYGRSPAATAPFTVNDDLHAVLTHARAPPTLLVGSSMGGAYALDYALAHPEMVRGLFLVAPGMSGGFHPPFDAEEQKALDYDDAKSSAIAQAWSKGETAAATEGLRALWCTALEGSALQLFHRMVEENLPEVFEDRSMHHATLRAPAEPLLPGIRVPTTLLIGDRDNPSMAYFVRRIARGLPKARVVEVPGADHLVNLSRPDAFDRALDVALRESA
ncbi:MAG: alpha/beta hydrolase [Thermoplasmata archaeon]|nr:alpha/beta hydrolase [Thermoplasmata archaeon]